MYCTYILYMIKICNTLSIHPDWSGRQCISLLQANQLSLNSTWLLLVVCQASGPLICQSCIIDCLLPILSHIQGIAQFSEAAPVKVRGCMVEIVVTSGGAECPIHQLGRKISAGHELEAQSKDMISFLREPMQQTG